MESRVQSLLVFVLLTMMSAIFMAQFPGGAWFGEIMLIPWTPSRWVFTLAWPVVFILLSLSAWEAWESDHAQRIPALVTWGLILLLIPAWSWLFFGLHRPGWAIAGLILLAAASYLAWYRFRHIRPLAGIMTLPVVVWAGLLLIWNLGVWRVSGGGLDSLFG